ncbi:MAG TPA: DMT family transporter [Thermoanaerobaculia bacterium]|nr:DMT family transporter [Thermoanaerobaculia bacterium]
METREASATAGDSSEGGALASRVRLLAAAGLFSLAGALVKGVSLDGWQVASFRSAVAALVLFALLPEARRRPPGRVVAAASVYSATMITFILATKLTTAASAIFLMAAAPLYVLLLGPWLLRERTTLPDILYMVALAAGLGALFVEMDPASATAPDPRLGNLLAVLSGVCWALTLISLRGLSRQREGGAIDWGPAASVWGNVITFAVCLPLALPVEGGSPSDWLGVAVLGVFQLGLGYFFLVRGLRRVPALEASLLLLLESVLNPVWAWLVHGERPGGWTLAGGSLILLATVARTGWDARRGL